MTLMLAVCAAVIFAVSVYLMLSRDLKSIAMGVFLVSHAAHLSILAMSGQPLIATYQGILRLGPPVLNGEPAADPLPQALILTSIVISFAVMAFMLTLLVVTHRKTGETDVTVLAEEGKPDAPRLEVTPA